MLPLLLAAIGLLFGKRMRTGLALASIVVQLAIPIYILARPIVYVGPAQGYFILFGHLMIVDMVALSLIPLGAYATMFMSGSFHVAERIIVVLCILFLVGSLKSF